jgi:hypothetical protein
MEINGKKITFSLVAYVLFSIAVMGGGLYYLYSPETLARTVIFAIGGILVLVFFGMRWFGEEDAGPIFWPPTVNTCPDYLTYAPELSGGAACVDMMGVSVSAGGLRKVEKSELASLQKGNQAKVFEYTGADVANSKTAEDMQAICDRCRNAGITWEGVYDGDTCVGLNRFLTKKVINEEKKCS